MSTLVYRLGSHCSECGRTNSPDSQFCSGCGRRLLCAVDGNPFIGRCVDGRFKVLELLGEGGMGQVYLAEQTSMGRPVALKVLSPFFGDEERIKERFRNEAALASRLNHPNTVIIYDFGVTDDGLMFIAMELVDGQSLSVCLRTETVMPWQRTARIVRQVCGSLQDAHEKTIIHRDLKPENIMLLRRGGDSDVVKVLDFGVAKILDSNDGSGSGLTAPNEIFGTPEYMSPEQARGDDMSPSTDIYSLGIMLFRMLSGRLPFTGSSPIAILAKQLTEVPPALSSIVGDPVPGALAELVDACLAKRPEDRPSTMAEISRELDDILSSEQEAPPEAGPTLESTQRSRQRTAGHDLVVTAIPGAAQPAEIAVLSSLGSPGAAGDAAAPEPVVPPVAQEDAAREAEISGKKATLEKLLRRIRTRRDFPAISQHISELNTKVGLESTSASQLSNVILKDTSLTTRLIKLVNSPYYGNTRGRITMVSRAVVLMGFDAVREAALGLLLFDNLLSKDPAQASALQDTAIGSLMSGILAKEQAKSIEGINEEEAFICAMFHNLGKHAAIFYFDEEMAEIRELISKGMEEERAVATVLGVTYPELGQELARLWDFPEQILNSMRRLPPGQLKRAKGKEERLHYLSGFANELTKAAAITDSSQRKYAMMALSSRFSGSIKVDVEGLCALVEGSLEKLEGYAQSMNLRPGESLLLHRMLKGAGRAPSIQADARADSVRYEVTRSGRLVREPGMNDEEYASLTAQMSAEELSRKELIFEEGMEEVSNAMRGRFDLNGVMLMVLETMYRGLGLNRVIFCLYDVRTKALRARFGFGEGIDELISDFHFQVRGRSDYFSNAMSSGEDVMVVNTPGKRQALAVPAWYRSLIDAPLFLLYPIRVKQFPTALFYGDLSSANVQLAAPLMKQMEGLRDQAAQAITLNSNKKTRKK